jgi:hypothetical protein
MPKFGEFRYPCHWSFWHDESVVLAGNALATTMDGLARYASHSRQSPVADGDTFAQQFVLDVGAYTLSVLGVTLATNGRVDWYIDDVKVVSLQDWYSSGSVYNVVKTATVAVASSGRHVLKAIVNGKNASSSAYSLYLTKFWLNQAGVG